MIAKTAKPMMAKPLNEKEMKAKYADRVRTGKTKRDKARKSRSEGPIDAE